jgi:hypothetical protein
LSCSRRLFYVSHITRITQLVPKRSSFQFQFEDLLEVSQVPVELVSPFAGRENCREINDITANVSGSMDVYVARHLPCARTKAHGLRRLLFVGINVSAIVFHIAARVGANFSIGLLVTRFAKVERRRVRLRDDRKRVTGRRSKIDTRACNFYFTPSNEAFNCSSLRRSLISHRSA